MSAGRTHNNDVDDSTESRDSGPGPPREPLSRETIRFLSDVASRPLSTTVSRYQRLNLSRRRGNAIRKDLVCAGIIEAVPIATRSGQVVLCQLTDHGWSVARPIGIDPGPRSRASLEHSYWVNKAAEQFGKRGYEITLEYHIEGDGDVDLVAERPGERIAIEVETGKSNIQANLKKLQGAGFDRIIFVATSSAAVSACQKVIYQDSISSTPPVELMTWLDVG